MLFVGTSVVSSISGNQREIIKNCQDSPKTLDLTDDLVGYWSFDNLADVGHDDSNTGNNGILYGPTWTSSGKIGGCLDFNGQNNYVVVPYDSSLNLVNAFTVAAWFKSRDLSNNPTVVGRRWETVGTDYQYSIAIQPDGTFYGITENDYHYLGLFSDSGAIQLNEWYYGVYVYDGLSSIYKLYLNGYLIDSNVSSIIPPSILDSLFFGRNALSPMPASLFNGCIDEIRIYNRALSQNEILDLYNQSGNIPPIPLFNWAPEYPDKNIPITFDASISYDLDGEIVSYEWDFGDANYATGIIVNHVYTQSGTYEVVLNITDNEGAQNKQIKTIGITNHPPTVEILNIKQFDYLSGTVIITGKASDPDGNETLINVTVTIKQMGFTVQKLPAEGTTYWTCTWDTKNKNISEIPTKVSAQSEDDGGLVSDFDTKSVLIDNTKPFVLITRPKLTWYIFDNELRIPGTLPFAKVIGWPITIIASHYEPIFSLARSGIKNVSYIIDGVCMQNLDNPGGSSAYSYNGIHFGMVPIEVKVYDYANNYNSWSAVMYKLF